MALISDTTGHKQETLFDRARPVPGTSEGTIMSVVRPPQLRNDEVIRKFLEHCHRRQFSAKSTIIRQGDPSHDLFYIVKGSVTVLLEDDEGRELVLAYLNPGDFFGEIGLYNEHVNRSALVRAKTPCEVATISYEAEEHVDHLPRFCCSRSLSARHAPAQDEPQGRRSRLHGRLRPRRPHLLDLCREPDAMTHPDGMQIRVTRQELGRIVGCSREMVGRVLKSLEEQHLISVSGKTIVVFGVR